MKSICIKVNKQDYVDYIVQNFSNYNLSDTILSIKQFKIYKNIIIHYNGKNINIFLTIISEILSFFVVDFFQEILIIRLLNQYYQYFDFTEKETIKSYCMDLVSENNLGVSQNTISQLNKIFFNHLLNNKNLFLEGFINFRLTSYKNILKKNLKEAIKMYKFDKEYNDFIHLLKSYINSHESNISLVHLIYSNSNSYLLDENLKPIENISITKYKFLSDISFSSNDYILNSLLELLPQKIIIHLPNYYKDDFILTLQKIFKNKIFFCKSCNICNNSLSFPKI